MFYKLEEIPCPYCGHINGDQWESMPLSCWGEDGWQEVSCDKCEVTFRVKEWVTREYETLEEVE